MSISCSLLAEKLDALENKLKVGTEKDKGKNSMAYNSSSNTSRPGSGRRPANCEYPLFKFTLKSPVIGLFWGFQITASFCLNAHSYFPHSDTFWSRAVRRVEETYFYLLSIYRFHEQSRTNEITLSGHFIPALLNFDWNNP